MSDPIRIKTKEQLEQQAIRLRQRLAVSAMLTELESISIIDYSRDMSPDLTEEERARLEALYCKDELTRLQRG